MPSQDNAAPTATMRIVLWPTRGDADFTRTVLEDPLADATHEERINFAAQYADLSLLELWRRLRWAEWNAEHYRTEYERIQEHQKGYPALYRIQEMDARHKRVRALLDVPRRRTIPKAELVAALNDRVAYDAPANPDPTEEPTVTHIDDFSDNHRPEDQDPEPGEYREVWDSELPPGGLVCSICGQPVESEPCPDHAPRPPMTDAEMADHDASMTRLQAALRPGSAPRH